MTRPRERTQESLAEGDHSQIRPSQRPLPARPRPDSDGAPDCTGRLASTDASGPAPGSIDSSQIFAGRREVRIVHAGEVYRLLVTRNNKLILHK
jgi:hemin uptake protein HemP